MFFTPVPVLDMVFASTKGVLDVKELGCAAVLLGLGWDEESLP
jgi:hypothetical protein